MLFQTILQLNILLCATPALAGWVLAPLGHAEAARRAVGIVRQAGRAEAAAPRPARPVSAVRVLQAVPLGPAAPVRPPAPVFRAESAAPLVPAPAPPLASPHPFPHAARAP